MRSFVERFPRRGRENQGVKTMAGDVEDIIDNFMYYKNRLQNSGKYYTRLLNQPFTFPRISL